MRSPLIHDLCLRWWAIFRRPKWGAWSVATPSPRHLLRQAIAAARQGDRSRARMFLAKVTELDPEEPLGWLWRAGLAEEAEQALIWLNRALELDPNQPNARHALPRVRMQAAQAVA